MATRLWQRRNLHLISSPPVFLLAPSPTGPVVHPRRRSFSTHYYRTTVYDNNTIILSLLLLSVLLFRCARVIIIIITTTNRFFRFSIRTRRRQTRSRGDQLHAGCERPSRQGRTGSFKRAQSSTLGGRTPGRWEIGVMEIFFRHFSAGPDDPSVFVLNRSVGIAERPRDDSHPYPSIS